MLLNVGIVLFVLGLLIFVFSHPILDLGAYAHQSTGVRESYSVGLTEVDLASQVMIVFGIAAAYTIGSYLLSWLGLYHKMIQIERQLERSRLSDSAV